MASACTPWGRRSAAVACSLTLLLTGCATSDDDTTPEPGPTVAEPTNTVAPSDSDGITTQSDDYPTWSAIDGLETPRDDFGTAVVGSEIWAIGGMTGARGNRLVSIEILDTLTETWRTSDIEMPVGLASFETVAIGPNIYAFGGFDAESQATDFSSVLDTRTGRWRSLPPLPNARYAHTVTEYDGMLYVIGGRDLDGEISDVDVFDPETERWTTLEEPMPIPRDSHETTATPQGLVVAGGFRDYEEIASVDLFDPRTGTWSKLPALPEPMVRAGLAYVNGLLWFSLYEFGYVLDPAKPEKWEEANALTLSRKGFGYVVVDDVIYAIAGCTPSPLRDVRTVDKLELT